MARQDVGNYIYVVGLKLHKKLKCYAVYLYKNEVEDYKKFMAEVIRKVDMESLVYLFNHIDVREYYDQSVLRDYPQLKRSLENTDDGWEGVLNEEYKRFELLGIPVFSADEYLEENNGISGMYEFDIDRKCVKHIYRYNGTLISEDTELR